MVVEVGLMQVSQTKLWRYVGREGSDRQCYFPVTVSGAVWNILLILIKGVNDMCVCL